MSDTSIQSDSKYLLSEYPINLYPSLARAIGLNEAAIVQQIRYWMSINQKDPSKRKTHFRNGRWWTYNTLEEWHKNFCWQSLSTTKRLFSALRKSGILLREFFHEDKRDRTAWYSIDFEKLDKAVMMAETLANDSLSEKETMGCAFLDQSADPEKGNDLYTETTDRDYSPEINSKVSHIKQNNILPRESEKYDQEEPETGVSQSIASTLVNKAETLPRNTQLSGQNVPPFLQKNKNPEYEITIDDDGWAQMPTANRYKLPRFLTVRRLQLMMTMKVMPGTVHPAYSPENDSEIQRKGRQMGFCSLITENCAWEDEMFASDSRLSLKALRSYATVRFKLSQDRFNGMLAWVFADSVEWCKQHGENAIDILRANTIIDLFCQRDL